MKSPLLISLLVAALFTPTSCGVVDEWTTFDLSMEEDFVVESMIGINLPFNIYTPDITTDSESAFEVNDTRKDKVEEISLKSMVLTLDYPAESSFDFLKSIYVYIKTNELEEILIAFEDTIPDDIGQELTLTSSGEDFTEYIKSDTVDIRVETKTDELLLYDHYIHMNAVFRVNAKILGI